jgi:hypothetical protein
MIQQLRAIASTLQQRRAIESNSNHQIPPVNNIEQCRATVSKEV